MGEREGEFRDNFNTKMKIKLKCSKENVEVVTQVYFCHLKTKNELRICKSI